VLQGTSAAVRQKHSTTALNKYRSADSINTRQPCLGHSRKDTCLPAHPLLCSVANEGPPAWVREKNLLYHRRQSAAHGARSRGGARSGANGHSTVLGELGEHLEGREYIQRVSEQRGCLEPKGVFGAD